MSASRHTVQRWEREFGPRRQIHLPRYLRVVLLGVFGMLLGVGLPFILGSWPLFFTLVAALLVCGMFMLAIYQAGGR